MKPSSESQSGDNPGVSINFDAQAFHEQEEAEYVREEQQRQNELHALLSEALDDDLTDDEDDDEDGEVSHFTADPDISSDLSSQGDQPPHMAGKWQNDVYGGFGASHEEPVFDDMMTYTTDRQEYDNADMRDQSDLELRGETEGGNDNGLYYNTHMDHINSNSGRQYVRSVPVSQPAYSTLLSQPVFNSTPQAPPGLVPTVSTQPSAYSAYYSANVHQYEPATTAPVSSTAHIQNNAVLHNEPVDTSMPVNNRIPNQEYNYPPIREQAADNTLDDYRVHYKAVTRQANSQVNTHMISDEPDPSTLSSEYDGLQNDFLMTGGMTENSRLGQLQILYNARGRKIEELDKELKHIQNNHGRETRILKHKLALLQDERDGLENSLQQSQHMVSESQERDNKLKGQIQAMEASILSLQNAKSELVKQLQTAESAVESLNAQLVELGSSDSLSRARQLHESTVAALQNKYDSEILTLKEKLDHQTKEKQEKVEEVFTLKRQIEQLLKSSEQAQISKADTVNRLTRSLEESQRQCQQLLESNSGQETSRLKIQLQEAVAGRSISEELNNALQDEIKDLKEQLTIYESASSFGILPGITTSTPANNQYTAEDSFAQLGLHKAKSTLEFNTPDSALGKFSKEENVASLKNELERCLNMYRNKRHQVGLLQEELRVVRNTNQQTITQLHSIQEQYNKAKEQLAEFEEIKKSMESGDGSYREAKLQREVRNLTAECDDLREQIKDLEQRISEIAESEMLTKEANRELSSQMAEMVHQFDEDKHQALTICEETVTKHYESMKDAWRQEIQQEFENEKENLNELISQLKDEIEESRHELDEVKELYVNACKEKDELEEKLDQQWEDKLEQDLSKIRSELEQEKQREIEKLRESFTLDNSISIAAAREKWSQEQEQAFKTKLQTEITLAKSLWLNEQQQERESAVQTAVERAEQDWKADLDNEKSSWQAEQEEVLKKKLDEAYEMWRRTELPTFLENNKSPKVADQDAETTLTSAYDWHQERMQLIKEKESEKKKAVNEIKKQQQEEYKLFITEHQETLTRALKTAREKFDQEKEELVGKYKEELKVLQEREHHNRSQQHNKTFEELEEQWAAKMDEQEQRHIAEKEELSVAHRENLYKALEEARNRWKLKYEEAMAEQEMEWNNDREKMLSEAEKHVEEETQQLQQQHHHEMEELRLQHQRQLEEALAQLREELGDGDMVTEIAQLHQQLEQQEEQYSEEIQQLKQELEDREEQTRDLQQDLHNCKLEIEEQKNEYEGRIEKAEQQKQEAISAYSQSEKEHSHMAQSYKARLQEMGDKVQRLEARLKAAEAGAEKHIHAIQESLEREYSMVMERMKSRIIELQQQLTSEKQERESRLSTQLQRHSSTQTQHVETPSEGFEEMRSYYLEIITRMRKDVLQHVAESNEQAASKVRKEVLRERHLSAKRYRRYYLKCLSKLLDSYNREEKQEMMRYMEEALNNMPEQDSSCSSTSSILSSIRLASMASNYKSAGSLSSTGNLRSSTTGTTSVPTRSVTATSHSPPSRGDSRNESRSSSLHKQSEISPSRRVERSSNLPSQNQSLIRSSEEGHGDQSSSSKAESKSSRTQTVGYSPPSQVYGRTTEVQQSQKQTASTSVTVRFKSTESARKPYTPKPSAGSPSHTQSNTTAKQMSDANQDTALSSQDEETPRLMETSSSITSSVSTTWATPSELFSKLSPQHRLMLENSQPTSKPFKSHKHQSGDYTDNNRTDNKYYKLNLDFLNSDDNAKTNTKSIVQSKSESFLKSRTPSCKYIEKQVTVSPTREKITKRSDLVKGSLYTSSSLVDVRGDNKGTFSLTKSNSEDLLNNSDDVPQKPLSSAEFRQLVVRKKAVISSRRVEYLGSPPSKSQSMPNVADAETEDAKDMEPKATNSSYYQHKDMEKETSTSADHRSQGAMSHPSYSSLPAHLLTNTNPSTKKEGYRVSFKNIDGVSPDVSDDESVKSFVSSSSVNSFREALRSKRSHARRSGEQHFQVISGGDTGSERASKAVHRPIPLVTRHTQVPSPLPSKRK